MFNQERYICLYKYHWGGSFFLLQTLEYNSQSSLASKQDPIMVYVNDWQVVPWSINVVATVETVFIENERSCDVATTWKIEQQLLSWLSSLCEWKLNEWILQDTQFDHLNEVSTTRSALCCLFLFLRLFLHLSTVDVV